MRFQWDPIKAARNMKKHGVSFDEGATVFNDPLAATHLDAKHSDTEERCFTIGQSIRDRLLYVCHTDRESVTRILSVRPATPYERRMHEKETNPDR